MERVYTVQTWPHADPRDFRRWGVIVGPAELFRGTTWDAMQGHALTKWGAKREGRRIIRKNERRLRRVATKSTIEEVIRHD